MSELAKLQRALAGRLVGTASDALDCDPGALVAAARSLRRKRQEALRRILPQLWAALGPQAAIRSANHIDGYQPGGLLPHLDDAWMFAEGSAASGDPRVRLAARRELFHLRLHFRRCGPRDPRRMVERTGILLALEPGWRGGVVLRLGRWTWRAGWPPVGPLPRPITE